jgi:hypothetical protein
MYGGKVVDCGMWAGEWRKRVGKREGEGKVREERSREGEKEDEKGGERGNEGTRQGRCKENKCSVQYHIPYPFVPQYNTRHILYVAPRKGDRKAWT